jgi:hypothetical protein
MSIRYVLAPEAAIDLVQIWGYIKQKADVGWRTGLKPSFAKRSIFLPEIQMADTVART